MGYRGKLSAQHTGYELPSWFVDKYKEDYYIPEYNGQYFLNIASKHESKHHDDIIDDMHELLYNAGFDVWAIILWDDGVVNRHNLTTGDSERIDNGDFED